METNFAKKYSLQIILAIGALIGIISFFTAWYSYDTTNVTGLDLIKQAKYHGWTMYVPLITVILSIVSLFIGALPHCDVKIKPKDLDIIIVVFGVVMVVLFFALFFKDLRDGWKFGDCAGIGMWIGLVAGLIPIAIGALGFFGVLDKLAESAEVPTETPVKTEEPVVETTEAVDEPTEMPAPEEAKDTPDKPQ